MKTIRIESEAFKAIMNKLDQIHAYAQQNVLVKKNEVETPENEWIDTPETLKILGCCKRTLQRYRSSEKLKYAKIGGQIFYKKKDIEQFPRVIRKSDSPGFTIKGFFRNILNCK